MRESLVSKATTFRVCTLRVPKNQTMSTWDKSLTSLTHLYRPPDLAAALYRASLWISHMCQAQATFCRPNDVDGHTLATLSLSLLLVLLFLLLLLQFIVLGGHTGHESMKFIRSSELGVLGKNKSQRLANSSHTAYG
jgi:hypothetical protein